MAKFGVEVLLKYTTKPEWVKQMKNIEKLNRRKERQASEGTSKDSDDGALNNRVVSVNCIEAAYIIESVSDGGSRLTSRTAGADTILKLLEDSDASESDSERELADMRSRTGSVWLKEDTDAGDATDLLDRKSMILKVGWLVFYGCHI